VLLLLPFALAFLLILPAAHAQEVSDSLRYNTSISLGGNRRTGLNPQNIINGSFSLELKKSDWTFRNKSDYSYTKVNGFEVINDLMVFSVLNRSVVNQQRVGVTAIHVYENSLLYRINNRQSFKLGVTVKPLKKFEHLWAFVGVGYEHATYRGDIFVNSDKINNTRNFLIATGYLESKHNLIKDRLTLKYGLFYVHSLEESLDFYLWFTPGLEIKLNNTFSFGISYDARFRNVHLIDLPSFNDIISYTIKVSLGK
jgi:hypothetical protein